MRRGALSCSQDWRVVVAELEGAYAASTIRAYRADMESFEAWAWAEGMTPFPARPAMIAGYLEAQAGSRSIGTLERRLYALRKLHALMGQPNPCDHEAVRLVLRRLKRGSHVRPRQARAMTRAWLERCIAVQPERPVGLRHRAMLALGYDLLTRRSELVALRNDDVRFRADGTCRVLIRRSKVDPFGVGRLGFTSRQTAGYLQTWLDCRGNDTGWLFCQIRGGRPVDHPLSTTAVRRLVKEAAKAAGATPQELADFSGHSLRVGAAQDLLRMGHDAAAIMRAGGWKSLDVLARYLEHAEHNVWETGP